MGRRKSHYSLPELPKTRCNQMKNLCNYFTDRIRKNEMFFCALTVEAPEILRFL